MNAKQMNEQATGLAVSEALGTITATHALPALADKHVALKTQLKLIGSLATIQALPTAGNTDDRDRVLADTTGTALAIAGPVASYAHASQLGDLKARVELNPSDFTRLRLASRPSLAQQVHDAAAGVIESLAPYGITQPMLDEFQAKIDAANVILGSPRSRIIARRLATEKLLTTFQEMNDLIGNELDPLMAALRKTDPDSYALYQAARVVIDRPGNPTPAPAAVTPPAGPAIVPTTPPVTPAVTERIAA